MPKIELDLAIAAPIEHVWEAIVDIESYPATMANVQSTAVLQWDKQTERLCAWSISLKGAILQWEEREWLDHEQYRVDFEQTRGDMSMFRGHWALEPTRTQGTRVQLVVLFEIGIPMLAQMLDPIAELSLRENCEEMLAGIEVQTSMP